jgi:hypothetical protein
VSLIPHQVCARLLLLAALFLPPLAHAAGPATLAVVPFAVVDTSGEPGDQRAAHAARLQAMMGTIRGELAGSGVVAPVAAGDAAPAGQEEAIAAARAAGASHALLGVVQKTSTLVLWCRASIVEVASGEVVFDRWLSFRGDNDAAWQRAGSYLARQIAANPPARS